MAYKWSWAFGPETALELENLTPWEASNTSTSYIDPTNTITHTYTGDAGDRYSMGVRQNQYLDSPLVMSGSGWFSAYFYYNGSANWSAYDMLRIWGPASGYDIGLLTIPEKSFVLVILNTEVAAPSPTLNLADDTWHHLAVKYDMTLDGHHGAEVFINGVSVMSGSRTHGNLDAESSAYFSLGGVSNALPPEGLLWSDIVIYDSLSDPNPYGQLVTRTGPTQDLSDSGSWTPTSDGGTDAQSAFLAGQIATTPVVAETDPLTGEYVRVNTDILGTTLGLDSFNTYGVTGHLFASGSSATNIIAGIGHNPSGPFTTGSAVIDGTNAYAWTSSGSVGLVSGSSFVLNAEISGS